MKNLVLTVALVALLAAAVLGGQALASSKPADVTVSEETSAILGSSYWGYPLRMKTLSDVVTVSNDSVSIEENYSGARHVSLTIYMEGVDEVFDWGSIQVYFADDSSNFLDSFSGPGALRTYEFDAKRWEISAYDGVNPPILIKYHATITYPSNQW